MEFELEMRKREDDTRRQDEKKWDRRCLENPAAILPKGLDAERKRYLFEQIRDFCKDECKDLVCPNVSGELSSPDPSKGIGRVCSL